MHNWTLPLCSREQFSTTDWHQICQRYVALGVQRVILRPALTARRGFYSLEEIAQQLKIVQEYQLLPIIEWNILMEQFQFEEITTQLRSWLDRFPDVVISIQDWGGLFWLKENFPLQKIQLNLETGHRNFTSISQMVDYVGERLESVVLSFELTKDKLQEFKQKLSIPVEIFYFGQIPLFYSPRKLLTSSEMGKKGEKNGLVELLGKSEESPHTGFPLVQNQHGTFMYSVRELSLLDVAEELTEMNVDFWRIDLSHHLFEKQLEWLELIVQVESKQLDYTIFKQRYPADIYRGFYGANRSSVLFEKLKNRNLARNDKTYVGEVIEVMKKRHLAVLVQRRELKVGDTIFYMTPEGKRVDTVIRKMVNTAGVELEVAQSGTLIFLSYQKSISAKSIVNLVSAKDME